MHSIVSVCLQRNISQTSRVNNLRTLRIKNAKFSGYYIIWTRTSGKVCQCLIYKVFDSVNLVQAKTRVFFVLDNSEVLWHKFISCLAKNQLNHYLQCVLSDSKNLTCKPFFEKLNSCACGFCDFYITLFRCKWLFYWGFPQLKNYIFLYQSFRHYRRWVESLPFQWNSWNSVKAGYNL